MLENLKAAYARFIKAVAAEPIDRWPYPEVDIKCCRCGFERTWPTDVLISSRGPKYDLHDHQDAKRKECGRANCEATILSIDVNRFYR